SDVQGTTRDTLTESVNYRDIKFNFVDTAGIRDTTDVVEIEGVKRAQKAADCADVVLHVTDDPSDRSVYPTVRPQVRIYNKCDLYDRSPCCVDSLIVSAKSGDVEIIKSTLYEMFSAGEIENSDLLITNERHLSCLKLARKQLSEAQSNCQDATLDVVTSLLRQAWETMGEITGSSAREDIIDRIYSKFCLGK
ncbi:MAG: 50S ribosome-binding GTPase, partial [Clostridiales bacterium]|nr:50S ribosome-binding GTPase [Clostridiales bacterium]